MISKTTFNKKLAEAFELEFRIYDEGEYYVNFTPSMGSSFETRVTKQMYDTALEYVKQKGGKFRGRYVLLPYVEKD